MVIVGYIVAILIGISLGLIGGGGSILTVPVLVYLFNINPALATSYSLFVVGSTSLVGSLNSYREGHVKLRIALLFGIASISTTFLTRKLILPLVPKELFSIGGFAVSQSMMTMVLFAILMLLASLSMIRNKKENATTENVVKSIQLPKLLLYGTGIGLVTGILGAGGGFLLIPALVLLLGLPMKEAVGTSLLIIALNSLIGFTGDLGNFQFDWLFLTKITAIAVAGIFVGDALGKKIPGAQLKKGFGWFVLAMGIYILAKELILK